MTAQTRQAIPPITSRDITIQDVEEVVRKIDLLERAEIKCLSHGLVWMSGMWNRKVMALQDKRDSMMVSVLVNRA